jgi:hypothetical protein
MHSHAGVAPDSASNELQEFLRRCFALRQAPQKINAGPGRVLKKNIMRSCCVIVNASLAGVAPYSACNELQEFCAALLLRWSGHLQSMPPGRVTPEKGHVELLRDCECVPEALAPDSAFAELQEFFERRCFALE